ncbi:MAG: septum formation initiator family protein [Candidatus Cloacimonadota bacterium]|nr:septum formation initiator family protein [Candidatus Cloacimonadota bacterium]
MSKKKDFFTFESIQSLIFRLVLIITITIVSFNIYVIHKKHQEIAQLNSKIEELQHKNEELSEYNDKIKNDPEELERKARKVGMRSSKDKKVFKFWKKEGELDID